MARKYFSHIFSVRIVEQTRTAKCGCHTQVESEKNVQVAQLCPTLCDPMEFSRPEYWSG